MLGIVHLLSRRPSMPNEFQQLAAWLEWLPPLRELEKGALFKNGVELCVLIQLRQLLKLRWLCVTKRRDWSESGKVAFYSRH
jgi:hypothetical protein